MQVVIASPEFWIKALEVGGISTIVAFVVAYLFGRWLDKVPDSPDLPPKYRFALYAGFPFVVLVLAVLLLFLRWPPPPPPPPLPPQYEVTVKLTDLIVVSTGDGKGKDGKAELTWSVSIAGTTPFKVEKVTKYTKDTHPLKFDAWISVETGLEWSIPVLVNAVEHDEGGGSSRNEQSFAIGGDDLNTQGFIRTLKLFPGREGNHQIDIQFVFEVNIKKLQ